MENAHLNDTRLNKPRLVTVNRAIKELVGIIPPRTLRAWVRQGKIPSVASGATRYINPDLIIEQIRTGSGQLWD